MTINGEWQNWGRSARIRPQRVERPRSPEGVQRVVRSARNRGMGVKPVGAGHSFTGIAIAPGAQLDLSGLSGLVGVDAARQRVTLRAGTRLHQIPALLAPYGLAMPNLGDIDRQSISGAISTGTHGTGARFGGLATQVVGLTIVTAAGEFRRIDEENDPQLLPAFALGLGALGVIVDVTLQCVPAFLLHAVERPEPLGDVLATLPERVSAADHFEFYWFPHTETALTKTNTRLPESALRKPLQPLKAWFDDTFIANGVYRTVLGVEYLVPSIIPGFAQLANKLTGNREYVDHSHRVFTQDRTVRFREMEYAIPAEHVPAAFAEIRELLRTRGWRISFPIEVRFAASDDRWLSTAYGRDTGYIAVHRYWREDPSEYFLAIEDILRAFDGRPHWGKLHTRAAEDLRPGYERFDDFVALRDEMDPERMFSNRYLDRVLGS